MKSLTKQSVGWVPFDRAEEVVIGGFALPGGRRSREATLAALPALAPTAEALGGIFHLGRVIPRGFELEAGLYPLLVLLPTEWMILRRFHPAGEPPVLSGGYEEIVDVRRTHSGDSLLVELAGGRRLQGVCSAPASKKMVRRLAEAKGWAAAVAGG
jgi:hypothetical protein